MAELVDDSSSSSGPIGSETVVEATTAEGSLISSKVVKQGSEQEVDAVFKKYGITGDKKESPKKKVRSHPPCILSESYIPSSSAVRALCRRRSLRKSSLRARK